MTQPSPQPITLQSRIPNDAAGETLLTFLAKRFRYHDRSRWLEELAQGRLQLNGELATGNESLRGGMRLRYEKIHQEPAVNLDYTLLHKDADLLAINKPPHLPMHADGPFIRNTLIHQLREDHGDTLQLAHRLDRETSGVCMVARSKEVQTQLQAQFQRNEIRKVYVAVVHGRVESRFRSEQPIGHSSNSIIKIRRSAADDASHPKDACTDFEPIDYGPQKTLVRCLPSTGRTHQIRVHLEQAGHPVVGDKLYGHPDDNYLSFIRKMKAGESVFADSEDAPNRHLLHAHQLRLRHPTLQSEQEFEAPIPPTFTRWLLS